MFAEMAKLLPLIPLGTPDAQFQPVWVEDVARAIAGSVAMPETAGKTYPLVGPRVYTLRELLNLVSALSGSHCTVIGLGKSMSAWQASVFERLPGKLITRDNLRSMSIPSTSATPFPHIFGSATAMENVIGSYLHGASGPGRARYQAFRDGAGR
jgi:NADH dehydrogenase